MLSFLQLDVASLQTWETFQAEYGTAEERAGGYTKLHSLLQPHIIRRMKRDVEKSLPPKVSQILVILGLSLFLSCLSFRSSRY